MPRSVEADRILARARDQVALNIEANPLLRHLGHLRVDVRSRCRGLRLINGEVERYWLSHEAEKLDGELEALMLQIHEQIVEECMRDPLRWAGATWRHRAQGFREYDATVDVGRGCGLSARG